ncbi:MAG: c-type cytochrome [Acetobacteraceae bacterium]|nr:c-type cytochrome [Acetobacteraceae bacterium]
MKPVCVSILLAVLLANMPFAYAEDAVTRGKYLVTIMGCGDCHTPGYFLGKPDLAHPLSGSDVGFEVPGAGIHWGPNLTPDRETGLGQWSDKEIITAIRKGVTRDGRHLIPVMPYRNFSVLTDRDARAIVAYLRTLPPVRHAVPQPVPPGEKASAPYMAVVMPH